MTDIAELGLRVDSQGFVRAERDLDKFNRKAARTERASERMGKAVRVAARGFAVLGAASVAVAADAIRLGVAAEETANKFRTVFRGSVVEADRQLTELSKTVPLTISQLRGLAASTQDLLVPMGLVREEAARLSVNAVSLAGDIASFNNVGTEDVLRAIQSALAGSSEPMRRFGVDTRETRLQTLALNEGLIEEGEALDAAARGQAVFRAITLDSADAVGDLVRTQDSAANSTRRLSRDLRQVREDLGTALLPVFTELVSSLNDTEGGMSNVEAAARGVLGVVGRLAQGVLLLAEGFSSLGRVIALTAGELKFLFDDLVDFEFAEAIIGENEKAVESFQRTIAAREEFREAFSEDFGESRERFQRLFSALGESLDDFASGTREALTDAGNAAEESTTKIDEGAGKAARATEELVGEMADLEARLRGPLQSAIRDFQSDAQAVGEAFRDGSINGEQAARILELLEQRFQQTSDEIGQGLAVELERLAFETLPAAIQQMLGLADATGQVANQSQFFSRIGSGFSQSIFNGQSIQDSISSALIGVGGQGLSDQFGEIFEDGFKSALENLGDAETWKPSAEGFALALGQAAEGNIGQAAFTAVGNAIGGPIGALIGSIIGDAVFGGSVPKFQVRGPASSTANDAGTDRLLETTFGTLEIAFRDIEDQAKTQIINSYSGFLETVAGVIRDEGQRNLVADAIAQFGVSSRSGPDDIEGQLNLLFDDILGTFDTFTENFVNVADTLETRVQRLADVFAIQNRLLLGEGFGLSGVLSSFGPIGGGGGGGGGGQPGVPIDPGFGGGGGVSPSPILRPRALEGFSGTIQDVGDTAETTNPVLQQTLLLLDDLRVGNESLVNTFARLNTVVESLDTVAGLTGNTFADTREGLVRFGAELVSIFGDDADAFSGLLNRVLEAAFSDDELAQQTINAARQRATDLLTAIGISVSESTFTQEGLRDLIDNFLGNLDAEDTAQLLAAGDAIATLIEAQNSLTDATEELTDATEEAVITLAQQQDFLRGVGRQALEVIAPARLEFAQLTSQLAENARQARELNLSEEQLNIVRLSSQIQIQGFIAGLSESIANLNDRLFGTGEAAEEATTQIQRGIENTRSSWLSAIDQIRNALDSQLTGSNSSLTNRERLEESERQLREAVAAAQGGDVDAARQIAQLFNQTIAQGAGFFGTSTDSFAALEASLRQLVGNVNLPVPPEVSTAENTAATATAAQGIELSNFEQVQLASQLLDQIGILTTLQASLGRDISASALAESFGVPIADLIRILTGEVPDLTGDALATYFDNLVAETNQQLNELAALEDIGVDQLTGILSLVDIAERQLRIFEGFEAGGKFREFAGPAPGDGVQPNGFDFQPVIVDNSGIESRLERLEQLLTEGNSDRRRGVETITVPLEENLSVSRERLRILRQTETSSGRDRRDLIRR